MGHMVNGRLACSSQAESDALTVACWDVGAFVRPSSQPGTVEFLCDSDDMTKLKEATDKVRSDAIIDSKHTDLAAP